MRHPYRTIRGASPALLIGLGLLLGTPGTARAQFPVFEWLAKNFEDLALFGMVAGFAHRPGTLTAADPRSKAQSWGLTGFGLEASFGVGSFWTRKSSSGSEPATRDSVALDTVQIQVKHLSEQAPETTYTISRKVVKVSRQQERLTAEIALGYTELSSFGSAAQGLDLRGTIRELPSLALYVNYEPRGRFSGYLGARTGLAQLQGFRGYVATDGKADSSFTAGGTTFQVGVAVGGIVSVEAVTLFVEPSYTYRNFESVEWSNIDGFVSDRLPRALDLSTWMIAFGMQFPLGRGSKGKD